MPTSQQDEIDRYLATGQSNELSGAWPGANILARAQFGAQTLRRALISAVKDRSPRARIPDDLVGLDIETLARKKVEPMVQGLFPAAEQPAVLAMLSSSVVFLTPCNIDTVLRKTSFLSTAWKLANMYLLSLGAKTLSDGAPNIVGLSENTTCYVSMDYFHEQCPFDDFVVHEAAHVFHNCKRATTGLREIRGREWLLEIDFGKRETFAYACEAYSCIVAHGDSPAARKKLLATLEAERMPGDTRVDAEEYIQVLRDAVNARNGWKRILKGCAPPARHRAKFTGTSTS
jgi:hypothetical protein